MDKGRLEAFTDGVIAVIITIMVLELKPPHEATWHALMQSSNLFLAYVLSFVYVGIYWNNHHHMLHLVRHVDGKVLWSNLFFLFWLSLFPFTTAWLNEAEPVPAAVPTAVYGVVLLMTALSWLPLQHFLIRANGGRASALAIAVGGSAHWKEAVPPVLYLAAIVLAFFAPIVSCALYALVAALWFVPDRRIESKVLAK
jgi:TMEM175 potassium channel family protein